MGSDQQDKKGFIRRRLERACTYVSDMWFPTNPALVSRLRETLAHKPSAADFDELIMEIQGDYALYFYCLKELYRLLSIEGLEAPTFRSPQELFRWGGVERLKLILDSNDTAQSPHSLENISDAQRRRLTDSLVSASTTQVLARNAKIDPGLGYSAGLIRQLGLTLIAWNYPTVYEKALTMLTEDNNIDTVISQELGFSPTVLAVALAHRWGLPRELYAVLEDPDEQDDDEPLRQVLEVEAVGSMLANLCRVGETLARANNPEDYPTARRDWVKAQAEIVTRLGPDGIKIIQGAVTENCEQYTISTPTFFRPGLILDPETRLTERAEDQLLASNPYLSKCSTPIREKLQQLYRDISSGKPSEMILGFLINEVIKRSGFTTGAVFTIEPSTGKLVPQLRIGTAETRDLGPVPAMPSGTSSDLVTLAYQTEDPIVRNVKSKHEVDFICAAGLFGFLQRIGVLFLEMPKVMFDNAADLHLNQFRAFARALNDCLELR